MRPVFLLSFVLIACATAPGREGRGPAQVYRNVLRPFVTDGCSNFPDGVPFFNETKWLRCCLNHDVAYWRGGSAEERKIADQNLFACVSDAGHPWLARLMQLGVRAGGGPFMPTSARWGNGWTIDRDYAPLNDDEEVQVKALYPTLPENPADQPLAPRPFIRQRSSLTGDHCLDAAVVRIELKLHRGFRVEEQNDRTERTPEGWRRTLELRPDGCAEPFRFRFLLLRKSACTDAMNELTARGRIRLESVTEGFASLLPAASRLRILIVNHVAVHHVGIPPLEHEVIHRLRSLRFLEVQRAHDFDPVDPT